LAYTRSLPRLWADSGPDGRQALVVAIFARLDVLGFRRLEYELTPDAIDLGLDAALPPVIELGSKIGEFGRGERTSADQHQPALVVHQQVLVPLGSTRTRADRGLVWVER
jgi:hypothetical protein